MWVGRAAVFLVGLALLLALVFGAASTVEAHTGNKGFLHLGHRNVSEAISTLVKRGAGPALNLKVESGPPLGVNSSEKVAGLNADQLDGVDSTQFAQILDSGMTTIGPSSIAAQSCATVFTVDPPVADDISNGVVVLTPSVGVANENLAFSTIKSSSDHFRIRFCNITTTAINAPSANYHWMIFLQP